MKFGYRITYKSIHKVETCVGTLYTPSGKLVGVVTAMSASGALAALRNLARKQKGV